MEAIISGLEAVGNHARRRGYYYALGTAALGNRTQAGGCYSGPEMDALGEVDAIMVLAWMFRETVRRRS